MAGREIEGERTVEHVGEGDRTEGGFVRDYEAVTWVQERSARRMRSKGDLGFTVGGNEGHEFVDWKLRLCILCSVQLDT